MNMLDKFLDTAEKDAILAASRPGLSKADQRYFARLRDMTIAWSKMIRGAFETNELSQAVVIISKLAGATGALCADKTESFNRIKELIARNLEEARAIMTAPDTMDISELLKDISKISPELIDMVDGQYCNDPACTACKLRKSLIEELRKVKAVGKPS